MGINDTRTGKYINEYILISRKFMLRASTHDLGLSKRITAFQMNLDPILQIRFNKNTNLKEGQVTCEVSIKTGVKMKS